MTRARRASGWPAAAAGCLTLAWIPFLAVPPASAVPDQSCSAPIAGSTLTSTPWAEQRLNYQNVWSITKGAGVRVAVIDSGVDRSQPQMAMIHYAGGLNVSGSGTGASDTRDCTSQGHGTAVTGIIAAPQVSGVAFYGVAPDATIIPVRQTASDNQGGNDEGIAQGIDYALSADADVINISEIINKPSAPIEQALSLAAAKGVVVVAASGNETPNSGVSPVPYPAAYASTYSNVIAVGAVNESGAVTNYSIPGSFVSVVAPGDGIVVPAHQRGYHKLDGTSFSTPFVTGTVALMLSAHPGMTPQQVRARLETTADPPPVTVPSTSYGYGTINPYRAVTALQDSSVSLPTPARAAPLPPQAVPKAPDRRLDHIALGAGLGLIGLALIAAVGAVVFRRTAAPTSAS